MIRQLVKNNNSTSAISPLCSALPSVDNQWHFINQDKDNCLNDYIASIPTVNDENTQLPPFTKLTANSLSQIICTEQEIEKPISITNQLVMMVQAIKCSGVSPNPFQNP